MKTLKLAVAAALSLSVFGAPALADYPEAANVSKYGIAVVDIGYVFDNHSGFVATMKSMKSQMEQIEQSLKTERDRIAAQEKQLAENLKPNTPEYKALDEQIARAKADFNLKMNSLRKDLMAKESQVYFQTYQQVRSAVTNYARQRNIGLVLRFNGEEPNPDVRPDIIKAINNPIWHQDNIDITREVLAIVNGGAATRVSNQQGAVAQPGQPQR